MYMNKVLFWDFQGTLAYNDWMISKALYKVLVEYEPNANIKIDDFKNKSLIGFPWQKPEKDYKHLIGEDNWWKNAEAIFKKAYESLNISEKDSLYLSKKVKKELINPNNFTLYEDTIEMLSHFKNIGFTNIILSNHIPELADIVKGLGLSGYIDLCISSGNVGYEKPNPKIYEYALKNAQYPKNVWMIGDNLEADVRGAESMGIKGILVRSNKDSTVRYYSKDLRGLKDIIN